MIRTRLGALLGLLPVTFFASLASGASPATQANGPQTSGPGVVVQLLASLGGGTTRVRGRRPRP